MGIQSPVLYSNGPFVTHPGGGYNGSDASAVQQTLGMNTLGIGAQYYNGYRLADDFTIPPGFDWQIDDITLMLIKQEATATLQLHPSPDFTSKSGMGLQMIQAVRLSLEIL